MRAWTELAPYNFIHALRLDEPADVGRWREAARETLSLLGITPAPIVVEEPAVKIEPHLEAELNRAFAPDDFPMRFFVIESPEGGHWFGVVIDHWFADDFSSRAMLRQMHARYCDPGMPPAPPELSWAKREPPRRNWIVEWRSFFQQALALRRARRIPLQHRLDFTVGAFRVELPDGSLEKARVCAKEQKATVHDVFLAAAAQACAEAYRALPGSRRAGLGLASAMDLRRFENDAARHGFGLLISQYAIVEDNPEAVSLPEVVARIARKTRRLKSVSGRATFVSGNLFWRLSQSRRARATIYQRGAPFAAGLSNVNLSGSWLEAPGIAEFRRVGPTGPVVPFVFMITTFRGRIFVDATYRVAAMSRPDAERLLNDFALRVASSAR